MTGGARPSSQQAGDPFRFDREILAGRCDLAGNLCLAGADEAGRGCLAGPLVAAAVVLDYSSLAQSALEGITDSKLLSSSKRERLYREILKTARAVSLVSCSAGTIDRDGLHRCNLRALAAALVAVSDKYASALVDGFELERADLRSQGIVGGDRKSAAVGAASVVAKVVRDRVMRTMAQSHPEYGFETHVGYGTVAHREALSVHGPCALHRLSFKGVGCSQLDLLAGDA